MDAFGALGVKVLPVFIAALVFLVPLQAQDNTSLMLLMPVEGTLAGGQVDRWTFTAASGAMVSFHVQAVSGDLDPVLTIENGAGKVIAQNDDYDAQDSGAALLEGVTLLDTGMYTATVSAFGETAGAYELTMLPGYAEIAVQEQFEESASWVEASDAVEPVFGNNRMALIVPRLAGRTIVIDPQAAEQAEGYIRVEIPEVSGASDWQVGLVVQQPDTGTNYLYVLNQRGQWRFTVTTADDNEQVIREWSAHPAIIPDALEFSLGLLVREAGFEFFYNDQLIGRVTDETITGPGQFGLVVQPPPDATSDVIAQFQNLVVTVPIADEPVIPDMMAAGDARVTLQELQRRRLIPMVGEFGLIVPESFVTFNRPGVNQIQLGGDQTFENFALGATVTWEIFPAAAPAGCGLTLGITGDDDYLLAYFDQTGAAGMSLRQGDTFAPGVFREGLEASTATHRLLVVADDGRLLYYVDGQLAGILADESVAGAVGNAVVNFEPTTTSCQFTDTWVWAWG